MTDLDLIWRHHAASIPGLLARRPDFRFDPEFYAASVPERAIDPATLLHHHREHGAALGHAANLYGQLRAANPDVDCVLADLVTDPELAAAIADGQSGACELACELIHLGKPIDQAISDFSLDLYLRLHPDIARGRMDPLLHYLLFGAAEGRLTLRDLRKGQHEGQMPYRAELPTCLIAVHECSRTGAPIVGLDLAREASQTHNVIVAALRGGPLLDEFKQTACQVLITSSPYNYLSLFAGATWGKIDFAIINSAVSWQFVSFLVAQKVPFAAYVHEYAEYMLPAFQFSLIPMFADLLIFSSDHVRRSWEGRLTDIEFDIQRDSRITPQRPLFVGGVTESRQADARARLSRIIGRNLSGSRIVCGAGQSQWRKGTDLFAMTAQICRQRDGDTVFVWIGDGLVADDLGFGVYMNYHLRQAGEGRSGGNLFFLPAGPAYSDVLDAADVLFMSSRLDPLPNVVFDALEHGCRIVQFGGATGFSDPLYAGSERFVTVEYANPDAAATAILDLPAKSTESGPAEKPASALFEEIRTSLHERLSAQRYFVCGASPIDEPVMFGAGPEQAELRVREREKMLRYRRRRVWRDLGEVEEAIARSDSWVHRQMRLVPYGTVAAERLPEFSIHLHAHYTDDLAGDIERYRAFSLARRIVVTTDSEAKGETVRRIMSAAALTPEIVIEPNTGRDILPFLNMFRDGGAAGDDALWCHLHQKKSIGSTPGGDRWRRFLMRILLGDEHEISHAVDLLSADDVGLVAPFDPYHVGWTESRSLLARLAPRLPGPMPGNPLLFPMGNMFWVRRSVVEAMNAVFGPDYPWPGEPIAHDGTEFHLIERLWPAMATHAGLDSVFVHKLDEKRV